MPVKSSKVKVQKSKLEVKSEKTIAKPVVEKKAITTKSAALSVPSYSLTGIAAGTLTLPKEVFGVEVNKQLLAQAIRVYMTNQNVLPGFTKTRGQVEGSSVKIYRQKGTGRARHGSIRASIFVGGGIVFGPKPRKVILDLPKKMKKAALISALSSKVADKKALGLSNIDKSAGKTKEIAKLLEKITSKKGALIVTGEKIETITRAVKNIQGVSVLPVKLINAYQVLKHDMLLLTKEAVEYLGVKK